MYSVVSVDTWSKFVLNNVSGLFYWWRLVCWSWILWRANDMHVGSNISLQDMKTNTVRNIVLINKKIRLEQHLYLFIYFFLNIYTCLDFILKFSAQFSHMIIPTHLPTLVYHLTATNQGGWSQHILLLKNS